MTVALLRGLAALIFNQPFNTNFRLKRRFLKFRVALRKEFCAWHPYNVDIDHQFWEKV
jgi:hypothetical protein